MSYKLNKIVSANLQKRVYTGLTIVDLPLTFPDTTSLVYSIKVDSVSSGINSSNPVVVLMEQSWDQGATWETVATIGDNIDGVGTFVYWISPEVPRVSVLARIKMLVPAGESVEIDGFYRTCTSDGEGAATRGINIALPPVVTTSTTIKYGAGGSYLDTPITNDITTPANVRPMPTLAVNTSGQYVDVAGGLTTIANKLDTIITNTDTLELTSENIALNAETIKLNVDGVETLLNDIKGISDTINVTTSGIAADISQINSGIPNTLGQKARSGSLAVTISNEDAATQEAISTTASSIDTKLTTTNSELATIKTDLIAVKDDVDLMQADIDVMQTDIGLIKADILTIKSDLSALKNKTASGLVTVQFDTIIPNETAPTANVYTYKTGGTGGTTVATLTVAYTGTDKSTIQSITVTYP